MKDSEPVVYRTVGARSPAYYALLALLAAVAGAGLLAAHHMESHGHYVTGMNNQIVWGAPHVFAVFLIVAASGALNVASLGSVFGKEIYKPLGRLSALLAVALLIAGLAVLVLDLGRPDRLIVAMTSYNFKSIFAWNIFLYTGFIVVAAVYMWMMFERRMNRYSKPAGTFALVWRFVLTTGTGSIFGFLVARQAYDAAIMAPMFILMSLSYGTAVFLLVLVSLYRCTGRVLDDAVVGRLSRLNGIFVAAVLYAVLVYHLTNLYVTEHHGVERFILMDGGWFTFIFWAVQVLLGGVVPLLVFLRPTVTPRFWTVAAALLVVLGGFAQVYVIIVGGQAYPLTLFPGMEVSSSFFDGVAAAYRPSLAELTLGFGGLALAILVTLVGVRILPFLPDAIGAKRSADA